MLFGESYGGKYAISIGKKILEENEYNLKGIAIFSGFISPYNIIGSIAEYSFENKIINNEEY